MLGGGGQVSRNAVSGKVHRLGLQGRATPSRPKRVFRRTAPFNVAKGAVVNRVAHKQSPDEVEKRRAHFTAEGAAAVKRVQRVTPEALAASIAWDDLARGQCAWILGETDAGASRCCGQPVDPEAADFQSRARYCAAHGAAAVAELRMRREIKPRGAGHDYRERGSPSLFDRSAMGGLKVF